MSKRPHGKAPVSDEGIATTREGRGERNYQRSHGEKHVHLTNNIHIKRHLHLQSHGGTGGLMLDARRTALQVPLLQREVTALHKIRTLQDPGTSSSVTASSGGSSAGGTKGRVQTFIGDPHRDAQALAIELSGKLAKSAKVPSLSDGGSSRVPRQTQRRVAHEKNLLPRIEKKNTATKMTAEDIAPPRQSSNGGAVKMAPIKVDVRERIKRIEQACDGSTTTTLSGELRKEGLIKESKERERTKPRDNNAESKVNLEDIPRSDERWEEGPARREELARRVIEERGSSISSLSQLLGNHYGSGRSALMAGLVDDEERRSNLGESLLESDEEELSPMEREMTQSRVITPMSLASPLHLASLGSPRKEEPRKPARNNLRSRKPKSRRAPSREKASISVARPRGSKSTGVNHHSQLPPTTTTIVDDELDVSELPAQNGCGVQWARSRIHKYDGKSFLDVTGLSCSQLPEYGIEALMAEHVLNPVQSISSLDSDANALPLIIGEDAHDSDLAAYYIEAGRSRELPQKLGKRKVSLQNAVKDVPHEPAASTSRSREETQLPTESHRTLTHKYRPKKFSEIVGQAVVTKSLSSAIIKGKVAPVYLFMGPRGTGKTSAARVFAAGLNCESLDYARRPCGICRECGTMALNRSSAVKQIDGASNVDLATIRESMESIMSHARYKVFIVESCDLLSTEIWNAFLKVLEEPPRNVVFILITTNPEQIPATAASRCQKFPFSKVKEADIVRRLELLARKEGLVVEAGALALVAARVDGSLREAEIILDQLCLLDKNVSMSLVRELVGLPSDSMNMDLLDYALSADTVNTVRTMREVLASGIEPLLLVSQLGALITDILVGSRDVNRETRGQGFFNRNLSVKEEQHRLRQALKILSEVEKQLRVTSDRATWLTAALLQFAPDRSFLPSESTSSAAPSPEPAPQSTGPVANSSLPMSEHPSIDDPVYQTQVPEPSDARGTVEAYVESIQEHAPEVETATTLSEQKLEEAWAREHPQHQRQHQHEQQEDDSVEQVEEPSEGRLLEFQVFRDEALPELWKRVLQEINSRSLKHLLLTFGRLVAAGVAVDGSCAVVELEFEYPRDKQRAERSWRSICIAFQEVLGTAVELRIAFSDIPPDQPAEEAAGRTGTGDSATVVDIQQQQQHQPGTWSPPRNTEIITEDSNGDFSMRPGPSTSQPKHKGIANEEDAYLRDMQGAAPPRSRRRRDTKHRRHRRAKASESDQRAQQGGSGGITPRRLPPSRRRRVKRTGGGNTKPTKIVIPIREIRMASQESSSFGGGEVWESGPQLIIPAATEKPPGPSGVGKKLLSTMMEDSQSETDDIRLARKKIGEQRSPQHRNDGSLHAALNRRISTVEAERGLPKEVRICWKKASPQSEFLMRQARVKGVRKARGKALFLRLVPCSASKITRNATPVAQGVPPGSQQGVTPTPRGVPQQPQLQRQFLSPQVQPRGVRI